MASKIAKKGAKPVNGKGGRADEEEEKHEEVKAVAKNGPKEIQKIRAAKKEAKEEEKNAGVDLFAKAAESSDLRKQ